MHDEYEFLPQALNPSRLGSPIATLFQTFAGEVLSGDDSAIVCFPHGGPDGGIDAYADRATYLEIWDAKFIPSYDLTTLRQQLGKLADKYRRLIPSNARYSSWRNKEKPVRHLTILFSCHFKNLPQKEALAGIIGDALADLAQINELKHLQETKVKVHGMEYLSGMLNRNRPAVVRWFKPRLPSGIVPFDNCQKTSDGVHSYLSNLKLDYFPPSLYCKETGIDSVCGPEDILDILTSTFRAGVAIIGSGGVGKTRLCEEVGNLAKDQGWVVLRITGHINHETLLSCRDYFGYSNTSFLLIFDYLEDQRSSLSGIITLLQEWRNFHNIEIRLLGNCRPSFSSFLYTTNEQLEEFTWGTARALTEYFAWVTDKIIASFLPNSERARAKSVTRGLPALAVFLAFVNERKGSVEIAKLLAFQDFRRWLAHRTREVCSQSGVKQLALLSAIFPVSDTSYHHVYQQFPGLLDFLVGDGWIVTNRRGHVDRWEFAHDVIADQLLKNHIESIGWNACVFIRELFDLAEQLGAIKVVLRSLERISESTDLSKTRISNELARRIYDPANKETWALLRNRIFSSRCLTLKEREEILELRHPLWKDCYRDPLFQDSLARLLLECRYSETKPSPKIHHIVRSCLTCPRVSMRLIVEALRLFPSLARVAALKLVGDKKIKLKLKNHLFVSLLETGFPFALVESGVREWLRHNSEKTYAARLIIVCCELEDRDARLTAKFALPAWLERNLYSPGAGYVLRAALAPKGRSEVPSPLIESSFVETWIENNKNFPKARFAIEPWLRSMNTKAFDHPAIISHINTWIEKMGTEPFQWPVLGAWLTVGPPGPPAFVLEKVVQWLDSNARLQNAQVVFSGLLRYYTITHQSGKTRTIREALSQWLKEHSSTPGLTYLIPAWLNLTHDTDLPLVQGYFKNWISQIRWPVDSEMEQEDMSYMVASWFRATGMRHEVKIRRTILEWANYHPDSRGLSEVLKAWLDAARHDREHPETPSVLRHAKIPVIRYLEAKCETKDAGFLLTAWIKAAGGGGLLEVAEFIPRWLHRNSERKYVGRVIAALLEVGGQSGLELCRDVFFCRLQDYPLDMAAGYMLRGALRGGLRHIFRIEVARWLDANKVATFSEGTLSWNLAKEIELLSGWDFP